jgi:hypothetical protein
MYLARKNGLNALSSRRNPFIFGFLTVVLWIGFEFLAAVIAGVIGIQSVIFAYVLALVGGIIGAAISFKIVDNLAPGNYYTAAEKNSKKALESSHMLIEPGEIIFTYEQSAKGKYWYLFHNNELIKGINPGETLTITTNQSANVFSVTAEKYEYKLNAFIVELSDGEKKHVSYNNNKFSVIEGKQYTTAK